MAPRNKAITTNSENERSLRLQARIARKEKENINIPAPVEKKSRKLVKTSGKKALQDPMLIAHVSKQEGAELEGLGQPNMDVRLGADIGHESVPEFELLDDRKLRAGHQIPPKHTQTNPQISLCARASHDSPPAMMKNTEPESDVKNTRMGDGFKGDNDGYNYVNEPSYQPDPDDPFGFFAVERKVKHTRQLLKEQEAKQSQKRAGRHSRGQTSLEINLKWSENEVDDEEAERAFATPTRPRRSQLRPSSVPPAKKSHVSVDEEETPAQLMTIDLEELLPKRRGGRRTKRMGRKVQATVNDDGNGRVVPNGRRGRKVQPKNEDEEGEEIDLDVEAAQEKADRKKLFDDLEGYELAVETHIWL
ncbi:hypothetical protein FRB95_009051 [Tulasnella sp. JGI-2019a]|nr:hypothetical protein FRB95_009051 [Tulasnella sp. JGI-2019a]